MRRLGALTPERAATLKGVVFDLDGTLLTGGALTQRAFGALHALADAGLTLIVCTGRPAVWGEVVQRQWPVFASITENGAVAFKSEGAAVTRLDRLTVDARAARRRELEQIARALCERERELVRADDNLGRLTDITFDIGENRCVAPHKVAAVHRHASSLGARTFESSIHLHITLDTDDKASGTVALLARELGVDTTAALTQFAFVGDSQNDEACFNAFHTTFGVANVAHHVGKMSVVPRFVSDSESGDGFAEIAERLLALRSAPELPRGAVKVK